MKGIPFLLEIGAEEIPDWMIPGALEHLRAAFERLLGEHRLGGEVAWVDATPRRLVLRAERVARRQKDTVERVSGPPKSAGEAAAQGFARKLGVAVEELKTEVTPKGEYFAYEKKVAGRAALEILGDALPGLILGIPWPKTMYWGGKGSARFIRPLRWVAALLGGKVVPFDVAGVRSGNASTGHRRFGRRRIRIRIASYVDQLRENYVLVRAQERRKRIEEGIAGLLAPGGCRVRPDAALLETLTYLTEWPTPIEGSFEESYLALRPEVLVTVMRHHQKYFSVEREDGTLAPRFLAVMNLPADADGRVRAGNERVLRARFNDARFFWEFDQQKSLAGRVEELGQVTFHAQLGSYQDKARRMVELVRALGGGEHAARAALLAKCDLTTEMVKEFTELQGVVGGLYARVQGEPEEVAQAIYSHYMPVTMEDAIPPGETGRLVALADKLDTLREFFRIGLIPKGSRDPFALRRAAQGVVKVAVEGGLSLPLRPFLQGDANLEAFLEERVRYYFREIRGYAYDEVNAVMAAGWDPLPDLGRRLEAVRAVRASEDIEPLAAAFKRIRNILRQAQFDEEGPADERLLEPGPEAALHLRARELFGEVQQLRRSQAYEEALLRIASLRPHVDLFFDKVLVNAPEAELRRNRLRLLGTLLAEFSSIADFSELVSGRA